MPKKKNICVITTLAKREFKGSLLLNEFIKNDLNLHDLNVIVISKQKINIYERWKVYKKNKNLGIIKYLLLNYDNLPSIKEIILSSIDHLFCSISNFVLKFYINNWNFNYHISERKFIRLRKIIKYLKENNCNIYYAKKLNSVEVKNLINKIKPDVIILGGTGIFKLESNSKVINCHSSILPGIRGIDSEFFALKENKLNLLGHCVHYVNDEIDGGKIIINKNINYYPGLDNHYSLRYRNNSAGAVTTYGILNNLNAQHLENNLSDSIYRSKYNKYDIYKLIKSLK